jgi:hypothetical protein
MGGVYIDTNKKLLVPLRDIIPPECDFISVVDFKACDIFQAFIGARPGMPYIKDCIDQIVKNVQQRYYGKSSLGVTGPRLLGEVFQNKYGMCFLKPGMYELDGENVKMTILRRHHFSNCLVYDGDTPIIDLNKQQRSKMDNTWKKITTQPVYAVLWQQRKIYREPETISY